MKPGVYTAADIAALERQGAWVLGCLEYMPSTHEVWLNGEFARPVVHLTESQNHLLTSLFEAYPLSIKGLSTGATKQLKLRLNRRLGVSLIIAEPRHGYRLDPRAVM